jgi:hypothetical protein
MGLIIMTRKHSPLSMLLLATAKKSVVLALGAVVTMAGCQMAGDSHSGDATRVANTGDSLVASARTRCPGATSAIAEAEAASRAARAASDAVIAAGKALDNADKMYSVFERDAEKANAIHSAKQE